MLRAWIIAVACLLVCHGQCYALDAYYIGNSITWTVNPSGMPGWAASRGKPYKYGYHIFNGTNLKVQYQYPDYADFSVPPYGPFGNALTNYNWDVVTLAPFDIFDEPYTDAYMIRQFANFMQANPGNQAAQVYVFESWPFLYRLNGSNYTDFWDQTWNGNTWSPTIQTRDYFHRLVDELNSSETGLDKDILMVPVGEVMYELDKRMRAGEVPGFDSALGLYAPDGGIHLRIDSGYFVGSTVFYATMFGDNPMGLAVPTWMQSAVSPEFAAIVQRITWDVVAGHPHSGVAAEVEGDFNNDRIVDVADFEVWTSTFGSKTDLRADANLDFVVDTADYTIWRNGFHEADGEDPVPAAVPEPNCLLLLGNACLIGSCKARRRRDISNRPLVV